MSKAEKRLIRKFNFRGNRRNENFLNEIFPFLFKSNLLRSSGIWTFQRLEKNFRFPFFFFTQYSHLTEKFLKEGEKYIYKFLFNISRYMQYSIVDCRYKFNIFIRRLIFYGIYIYIEMEWHFTFSRDDLSSQSNIYVYRYHWFLGWHRYGAPEGWRSITKAGWAQVGESLFRWIDTNRASESHSINYNFYPLVKPTRINLHRNCEMHLLD